MALVRLRGSRGQALVEAVLGILVFVTVLAFGIYFAEVGVLSLKVQEATAWALWESTAAKMHDIPSDTFGLGSTSISTVATKARARYQGFDGRTSAMGSGSTATQVFTLARDLNVYCQQTTAVSFAPLTRTAYYQDTGGIQCWSQAALLPWNFPLSFLDSGRKLFQVRNFSGQPLKVCSAGRAWGGGPCQGTYRLLLDDWGLAGAAESGQCPLTSSACANQGYFNASQYAFLQGGGGGSAGSSLASWTVGTASPIDENTFWLSFRGEDSSPPFQETEPGGDMDPNTWMTGQGAGNPVTAYDSSYTSRTPCFLGLTCN